MKYLTKKAILPLLFLVGGITGAVSYLNAGPGSALVECDPCPEETCCENGACLSKYDERGGGGGVMYDY